MVAKPRLYVSTQKRCLNLAKIHMVAKRAGVVCLSSIGLNLAKIHMVAKRHWHIVLEVPKS